MMAGVNIYCLITDRKTTSYLFGKLSGKWNQSLFLLFYFVFQFDI